MPATRTPQTRPQVAPPGRTAVRAAWASFLSAVVGFVPLHLVWALGVPLFADEQRFAAWYDSGTATYLYVLLVLALLPAVLALALIRPWGLVFPGWVPGLAGRQVPRLLLIVPGYAVCVLLTLYTLYAAVLSVVIFDSPEAVFSPWTAIYGVVQFVVWIAGLWVATHSYASRTAGR